MVCGYSAIVYILFSNETFGETSYTVRKLSREEYDCMVLMLVWVYKMAP